jgi:hypothetical protein
MKTNKKKKDFDLPVKQEVETICKNLQTILEASHLNPNETILAAFLVGAGKGTENPEIAAFGKTFLSALDEEYEYLKTSFFSRPSPKHPTSKHPKQKP